MADETNDCRAKTLSGGCLCGDVRFVAHDVELHHHACHCGICRRWSGGPLFATPAARVEWTNGSPARYASSEWAERGFCTRCGSHLFYYLKPAEQYILVVGAFDDTEAFRLVGEIFIDRKPPGYAFAGDLPGVTEAEFLARYSSD